MTRERHEEFYVGYVDETPAAVARFTRRVVIAVLLLAAALGAGLALLLERFDAGVFEYGQVRDYDGELLVDPHPRLLTADGPAEGYLLVGVGKHGLDLRGDLAHDLALDADPAAADDRRKLDGAAAFGEVQLSGTLIRNPEAAMLEVHSIEFSEQRPDAAARGPSQRPSAADPAADDSVADDPGDRDATAEAIPADEVAHGDAPVIRIGLRGHQLVGEIVDTKCYLGAMKPGRGKPHRGCASLCIRGGIPAALLVRTANGERELVHLVDPAGRPLGSELLKWVGQPVEVIGVLRREDDRLVLALFANGGIRAATGGGS